MATQSNVINFFFFVHQDSKARLDSSLSNTKSILGDKTSLLKDLNSKLNQKTLPYTLKSLTLQEAEWWPQKDQKFVHEVSISKLEVPNKAGGLFSISGTVKGTTGGVIFVLVSNTFLDKEEAYNLMIQGNNNVLSGTKIVYFNKVTFDPNKSFNISGYTVNMNNVGAYNYYYVTSNLAPLSLISKSSDVAVGNFTLGSSFIERTIYELSLLILLLITVCIFPN